MKLFRNMLKWRGVERATPEISKKFLEETLARDKQVLETVERNSQRRDKNNLGPLMGSALGGHH